MRTIKATTTKSCESHPSADIEWLVSVDTHTDIHYQRAHMHIYATCKRYVSAVGRPLSQSVNKTKMICYKAVSQFASRSARQPPSLSL